MAVPKRKSVLLRRQASPDVDEEGPPPLVTPKEIVLADPGNRMAVYNAVCKDGFVIEFAEKHLQEDKEIALAAVHQNPGVFALLGRTGLVKDPDILEACDGMCKAIRPMWDHLKAYTPEQKSGGLVWLKERSLHNLHQVCAMQDEFFEACAFKMLQRKKAGDYLKCVLAGRAPQ